MQEKACVECSVMVMMCPAGGRGGWHAEAVVGVGMQAGRQAMDGHYAMHCRMGRGR